MTAHKNSEIFTLFPQHSTGTMPCKRQKERVEEPQEAPKSLMPSNNEIDFLKDDPSEMTWGRRIALYMASNFSSYNPYLNQKQKAGKRKKKKPSLAKAWAFFEHVTLERYVVEEEEAINNEASENANKAQKVLQTFHKGDRRLSIAEPGESKLRTRLYSPLTTPLSQMGDFGLGYGIYFSILRSYAILCLIAGLLNLPNFFYFASTEYNGPTDQGDAVSFMLKGSAVCTGKQTYQNKRK